MTNVEEPTPLACSPPPPTPIKNCFRTASTMCCHSLPTPKSVITEYTRLQTASFEVLVSVFVYCTCCGAHASYLPRCAHAGSEDGLRACPQVGNVRRWLGVGDLWSDLRQPATGTITAAVYQSNARRRESASRLQSPQRHFILPAFHQVSYNAIYNFTPFCFHLDAKEDKSRCKWMRIDGNG